MEKKNLSVNSDLSVNSSEIENPQGVAKQVTESHNISLLEEKLVVKRHRKKVGEVIIRKQVETQIIQIPIRREKLIVEKVGITAEHLAEIDLGEQEVNGIKFNELGNTNNIYQSQSQFLSLEAVTELLAKIKEYSAGGETKIRLEIITNSDKSHQLYQDIVVTANC